MNSALNEVDTFINSRDKIEQKQEGINILEKHKLQSKIDQKLNMINNYLSQMKISLDSDKKKKRSTPEKEEFYKHLCQRYDILKV